MNIAQKLRHFISAPRHSKSHDPKSHDEGHNENSNHGSHRCTFTFSDGRQCRMQSASFCVHHGPRHRDRGSDSAGIDAPELVALCSDLTNATNINRALTQAFLLMAQGRISRKQAVAFGYLTQLLLQTVPGVRAEFVAAYGYASWEENLKASLELTIRPGSSSRPPAKVYPQDELSPVNKVNGSEGPLSDPANSGAQNHIPEQQDPPASLKKHHLTPEAIYAGLTPADFESLYARSLDLFDRKYDFTPEGQREKQILNYELELIKPPDTKPPKGNVGEVVKLARRFKQELNPDPVPAKRVARDFYGNPIPPAYSRQSGGTSPDPLAASTHLAYIASPNSTPNPDFPAGVTLTESVTGDERRMSAKPNAANSLPPSSFPQSPQGQASNTSASPASPLGASDGDGYYSSEAYHEYCKNRESLEGKGHTAEWFAPSSWSGRLQPEPYPRRAEKLRGKSRSISSSAFRRIQHQNSRGFWSPNMKHPAT